MKQNLFARLTIQEQDTFVNTATETSRNPTKNLRTRGAHMQKYLERKKLHKFNNNNNSNDDGRPTPVIHMTLESCITMGRFHRITSTSICAAQKKCFCST